MVTLEVLKPGGQIKGWNTCSVWEPRICPTLHGGSLHPPKSILVTSEHWVWSDPSTSTCDPKSNQLKWWCSEDWIICFACRRPQRRLDFWHHMRLHTGQSSPPPPLPQIQWGAQGCSCHRTLPAWGCKFHPWCHPHMPSYRSSVI